MNNIINDNNYDKYKLLHSMREYYVKGENASLVTESPYYSRKEKRIETLITNGIPITMGIVVLTSLVFQNYLVSFISLLMIFGVGCFAVTKGFELVRNNLINKLKKDFPYLDFDINQSQLSKELQKYEELSKIPKNIEQQKEKHISVIEKNMRNLSTKEKIEYLKKESEFWNLVAIEENYRKMEILEEKKSIKKKKVLYESRKINN